MIKEAPVDIPLSQSVATSYRWYIVVLLFFATSINYLDRQVIGLLKPVLEVELGWTEFDYGWIVTGFTAAYAIGLLVFGRLIDKLGSKKGFSLAIIIWSAAAMLHGAATSTWGFVMARIGLGVGEGGNFPGAIKTVAEWFPKKERALATGLFNSGANVGALLAPIAVPYIAVQYGWQYAFVITGAFGFVWLIFWWIGYEIPQRHRRVSAAELAHIQSDEAGPAAATVGKIGWKKILSIRQSYAFILGKLLTDPIWWFFLFWLPSYFSEKFYLDLKNIGLPLVIVYTATTVGSIGGGWLSSYLVKRGMPALKARKTAMLLFALCVTPVMFVRYVDGMWNIVAIISLAAAAHQAWSANLFTTVSDMFPKHCVSSVTGIGGMAGAIGGALFPLGVGALLDHYDLLGNKMIGYNILFVFSGCIYLTAWFIVNALAKKEVKV